MTERDAQRVRFPEQPCDIGRAEAPDVERVRLVRVFAGQRPKPRLRAPRLDISIEFEGKIAAAIRGTESEDDFARMWTWLEDDRELLALCRLVHRLRDRLGAA